ncbi:MAG: hypothetical protein O6922_07545 [Chloroflexi bacterium]|nr:hypothetical protein [Chloroflexota bacterium]
MNLSSNATKRTRSKSAGLMTLCGLVATLAMAASAQGQGVTVDTVNDPDPANQSGFTLSFPDLGITTSSNVVNTNISIEIDEQAGTARFLKYSQLVEPLLLPAADGSMISTGDITINIKTSNGTFNSATQTFRTNDVFVITFTNDLSAFGLTSPTELPSVSTGTISNTVNDAQRIDMVWAGSGEIGDPNQPLRFEYISSNFTIIDPLPLLTAFQSLIATLCGPGTASMVSFMFLGLWMMKAGVRRRRR